MLTRTQMAQAIVDAHRALSIPGEINQGQMALHSEPNAAENQVYGAAKDACLALGFIEIDAVCVAGAWAQMVSRTGHFDASVWPCEAQDFGLRPWPRDNAFAACPQNLGLYAVLPDAAWVRRMALAGVPTVQLRFKSDDMRAIEREVQAAVEAVEGTGALLFINDHWQAAVAAGAYGIHLGQEDLENLTDADLNAIKGANLRLGLSSHGYAEMLRADAFSPSYIALGAVYPTTLKRMLTAPQGAGRLHAYAQLMRHYPLVAIGGIDESKLPDVLASGVGSVAVVRALVAAERPEEVAARFQAALRVRL